jgi:hypothetical protein
LSSKAVTIEPHFTTPERQSNLDPYADKLTGWLKTEAGKSRKQRRTLKHLHAYLVFLANMWLMLWAETKF